MKENVLVPGYTTYQSSTNIFEKFYEDRVHNGCFTCEHA